jgi:hypothetical protein
MDTVNFNGLSGATYQTTAYPVNQAFKAFGAVYIICRRYIENGLYYFKPIYIGVTGDMATRFDDHHKAACFTKNGGNFICVHSDANEASRFLKETDLINHWDPVCNG